MKRLERLGSVAFLTVTLSLVFHILAISFEQWKYNQCLTCPANDPLSSWVSSIRERCYKSSVASIFMTNESLSSIPNDSFVTNICLPNQYLTSRSSNNAVYCLNVSLGQSDTICSVGNYDKLRCQCDYTTATKVALALAIIPSILLGILIFLTHLISYVNVDSVLRWLLPLCSALCVVSMVSIILLLSIASAHIGEDVEELRFSWSLYKAAQKNDVFVDQQALKLKNYTDANYDIRIGWCFGLDIVAVYFALISSIIFGLMFIVKKRPE